MFKATNASLIFSIVCASMLLALGCALFDHDDDRRVTLAVSWTADVNARARGTPAIAGGRIIQAFDDRRVRAFDVRTGRMLWQSTPTTQGLYPVRILVGRDSIAVVTAANSILGYSINTGQQVWTHVPAPDSSVSSEPGAVGMNTLGVNADTTIVVVPAWGSTVAAVRVADGARIWTWAALPSHARRHGAEGAVWCGNTVYVSLWRFIDERGIPSEHSVVALDGATGRELWTTVLPYAPIVIAANGWMECDGTRVWATTVGGPVWALARRDGIVVRSLPRDRGQYNNAGPRRTGAYVFADAGPKQQIVSYDAETGAERWRTSMIGVPHVRMVGGNEFLWMSNVSFLYIFRVSDGKLVVTQQLNDKGISEAPLLLTERDAILPLENGVARVTLRDR